MKHISLQGEDIALDINKTYVVIDALYLDDIKHEIDSLNITNLLDEIREKVFPFTDIPFAMIMMKEANLFPIQNIYQIDYDSISDSDRRACLASDTGLLVFIDENLIYEFTKNFSYDDLVDSTVHPVDIDYWNDITSSFDQSKLGLVLAPGIDSGYEFEGSGTYKIVPPIPVVD